MLIQYDGPHPSVVVDEFSPEQVIANGQPIEVPNDLAARLLEQSTWSAADKKSKTAQKQTDANTTTEGNE